VLARLESPKKARTRERRAPKGKRGQAEVARTCDRDSDEKLVARLSHCVDNEARAVVFDSEHGVRGQSALRIRVHRKETLTGRPSFAMMESRVLPNHCPGCVIDEPLGLDESPRFVLDSAPEPEREAAVEG